MKYKTFYRYSSKINDRQFVKSSNTIWGRGKYRKHLGEYSERFVKVTLKYKAD